MYAVFIDFSGSVKERYHYWDVVGSIIKNKNSINRYFFWNDYVREK
jgi:hypothetical protein